MKQHKAPAYCNGASMPFIAVVVFLTASAQANAAYTFTPLGLDVVASSASSINDSGQVVGQSAIGEDDFEATLWDGATTTRLGRLDAGNASWANGIDNAGRIVGMGVSLLVGSQAFLWKGGPLTPIYTNNFDQRDSSAQAINASGQIVGWRDNNDFMPHATLWQSINPIGTATDLGTLGGSRSSAASINDIGQIAGWSNLADNDTTHAVLWDGEDVKDLGTLGGAYSSATGINNSGHIVGISTLTGGGTQYDSSIHAFLWNGTAPVDLGTLGGDNSSASAINNLDQIVGWSEIPGSAQHAVLWNGSTVIDMNDLLDKKDINDGWVLTSASDINDKGQIVGSAENEHLGHRAFILSPVPEPATYGMFLAGLTLLFALIRPRSNTRASLS